MPTRAPGFAPCGGVREKLDLSERRGGRPRGRRDRSRPCGNVVGRIVAPLGVGGPVRADPTRVLPEQPRDLDGGGGAASRELVGPVSSLKGGQGVAGTSEKSLRVRRIQRLSLSRMGPLRGPPRSDARPRAVAVTLRSLNDLIRRGQPRESDGHGSATGHCLDPLIVLRAKVAESARNARTDVAPGLWSYHHEARKDQPMKTPKRTLVILACGWVLWFKGNGPWEPMGGWDSERRCYDEREARYSRLRTKEQKTPEVGHSLTGSGWRWECFPGTLDLREMPPPATQQ